MEYVWNIPWSMKFYKDRKGLLRHALTGILPEDVLCKKSPFEDAQAQLHRRAARPDPRDARRFKRPRRALYRQKRRQNARGHHDAGHERPWFGQLMNAPQMLAYLLQINFWMKHYGVTVV